MAGQGGDGRRRPDIVRISRVATQSMHERAAPIDLPLVQAAIDGARKSERGREMMVLHADDSEVLQRMLNAMQPGSYVTPHRHLRPPKAESAIVLQGSLAFLAFLEDGTPDEENFVHAASSAGVFGVDYRAGTWHTFFALEPDTVVFEAKSGPYDPATDKEFAPWAPREGDPTGVAYFADLEDRFRARFGLPAR